MGCCALPLGVAEGFLIDGEDVAVPMAVEEPSVIAAARFAARLVRGAGGFRTWASEPLMTAQVFLEAGERGRRGSAPRMRAPDAGRPGGAACLPRAPGRGIPRTCAYSGCRRPGRCAWM